MSEKILHGISLEDIPSEKTYWVGGYPAHYVRKMHCSVEKERPGAIHFIYISGTDNVSEREYERGQLPAASTVLSAAYSVTKFLQLLNKLHPEALIITGYNHRLYAAALLWACWKRVRFCFWGDSNVLNALDQNPFLRLVKKQSLKLIFSRAHKLLYIGSRNRDFYIWLLGLRVATDKLFFLPYPAILAAPGTMGSAESECNHSQNGETLNILYLGRLEPVKAIHNLLNALVLLPTSIQKNVHFDIFGGGSEGGRLKKLTSELGLSDIVTHHGPVASDQVAQIYAKADLFVLPSDKEPWGLVVNEALSAGVPVMCPFWVGAAPDLVTDGETGYILENNTPACIASAIERAYRNRSANKQLGIQGRNRIVEGGWHVEAASAMLVGLVDGFSHNAH